MLNRRATVWRVFAVGLGGRRTLTGQDGFVSVFDHVTWNIELCGAHKVRRNLLLRRHNTHTWAHTDTNTQHTYIWVCVCVLPGTLHSVCWCLWLPAAASRVWAVARRCEAAEATPPSGWRQSRQAPPPACSRPIAERGLNPAYKKNAQSRNNMTVVKESL